MTLANFLDELYGYQDLPVLVYNEEHYDPMWDLVNDGTPMDKFGKEFGNAAFALHMKYMEYRVSVFLKEEYATAEVTHFIVTDECMLVFIAGILL